MKTLRIGICDAVPPEFYLPDEPSDPEKFVAMFDAIEAPFTFETYDVTQGHFPDAHSECDAYLVTGSPCSVYDTYTWIGELVSFIRELHAMRRPLVGICFGHQLIAQSLGGRVELADRGWLLGMHEIDVHVSKDWMLGEGATHPLYFINQDQVVELPPQVEHLAGSEACPNAMFTIDDHVFSLQAHPEQPIGSMHAFSKVLLDRYGLARDVYDDALESMESGQPHAERLAGWIVEFLVTACRAGDRSAQ